MQVLSVLPADLLVGPLLVDVYLLCEGTYQRAQIRVESRHNVFYRTVYVRKST